MVEPFSLGCEKKIRSKGAGETLLRQYTWVLSQGGVQVCMCTVEKRLGIKTVRPQVSREV